MILEDQVVLPENIWTYQLYSYQGKNGLCVTYRNIYFGWGRIDKLEKKVICADTEVNARIKMKTYLIENKFMEVKE